MERKILRIRRSEQIRSVFGLQQHRLFFPLRKSVIFLPVPLVLIVFPDINSVILYLSEVHPKFVFTQPIAPLGAVFLIPLFFGSNDA